MADLLTDLVGMMLFQDALEKNRQANAPKQETARRFIDTWNNDCECDECEDRF